MTATFIPVDPFDLVVFGGTGDLAMRKILPGLYHRDLDGQLPAESRIVGASRTETDRDGYVAQAEKALRRFIEPERCTRRSSPASWRASTTCRSTPPARPAGSISPASSATAPDRIRVFYLATAPDLFGPICAQARRGRPGHAERPASCSRSRSATTSPRARAHQRRGRRGASTKRRSSASTTTSARRRCRT